MFRIMSYRPQDRVIEVEDEACPAEIRFDDVPDDATFHRTVPTTPTSSVVPGDVHVMNFMAAKHVAHAKPIRFWLTSDAYVECMVIHDRLNMRGMSDHSAGVLTIMPGCSNTVDVAVLESK